MKTEHGKLDSNLRLDYALSHHGMITGNIIIEADGELYLHGMCCKDLMIKKGGKAFVYGTVIGNVLNDGGYLEVYGVINGYLRSVDGETEIDEKAIVKHS